MILVVSPSQVNLIIALLARCENGEGKGVLAQIRRRSGQSSPSLSVGAGANGLRKDPSIGVHRIARLTECAGVETRAAREAASPAQAAHHSDWAARLNRIKAELTHADDDEVLGAMVEKTQEVAVLCGFVAEADRPEFIKEFASSISENASDWAERFAADPHAGED